MANGKRAGRLWKCPLQVIFIGSTIFTLLRLRSLDLSFSSAPIAEEPQLAVTPKTSTTHHDSDGPGLRFPPAVAFFNGNPAEPQYLWTHSFSRLLRRVLPTDITKVYATKAREPNTLLEVVSNDWTNQTSTGSGLFPSEETPAWDLRGVEKRVKRKVWSNVSLIFSRSSGLHELLNTYPHLFGFCRGPNVTIATCPVVVHFPIGQTPCTFSCDSSWYTVVPDKQHVKPPSADIWARSQQLQQGIRPPTLSESTWDAYRSANCSMAYVSTWKESKGQLRLAQELVEYYHYYQNETTRQKSNWLLNGNLTICFAGSHTRANDQYHRTTQLLQTIGVRMIDFGEMSLVEQLALFAITGKSVLLTAGDFSPRVVYLSLVAGARVLTTAQAQVAIPVIDNDCLVTEWDLLEQEQERDGNQKSQGTVAERAAYFQAFLHRSHCQTFAKAQPILQEDVQYQPIVDRALQQWRGLNFYPNGTRNYGCLQLYSQQCSKYFGIRAKMAKKKQKG